MVCLTMQQQQQIYWYSHIQMVLPKITIYEITAITNMYNYINTNHIRLNKSTSFLYVMLHIQNNLVSYK